MSGPTLHQRLMGYVVNWKTGPGWIRDGAEVAKLRQDGMRVLKVQLEDNGPIPAEQAQEWRDAGMKVWGMVWVTAGTEVQWLRDERYRLGLAGLDLNCEEPVRAVDAQTGGAWSALFCDGLRRMMPTLPMHLDTYYGPAAATPGINLGAYKAIGCRFSIQTMWARDSPSGGTWDDPPTNIVKWCAGASPTIPKSIVKPIILTAPPTPDFDVAIADWKASGCKGGGLYPIESYPDFEGLRDLCRRIIAAGCCY